MIEGYIELRTPEVCPVCGEDLDQGALACPECGADEKSGWRVGSETYDGLDLPGESFDYDEFVRDEFGGGSSRTGIHYVWWITALLLVVALATIYFWRRL